MRSKLVFVSGLVISVLIAVSVALVTGILTPAAIPGLAEGDMTLLRNAVGAALIAVGVLVIGYGLLSLRGSGGGRAAVARELGRVADLMDEREVEDRDALVEELDRAAAALDEGDYDTATVAVRRMEQALGVEPDEATD